MTAPNPPRPFTFTSTPIIANDGPFVVMDNRLLPAQSGVQTTSGLEARLADLEDRLTATVRDLVRQENQANKSTPAPLPPPPSFPPEARDMIQALEVTVQDLVYRYNTLADNLRFVVNDIIEHSGDGRFRSPSSWQDRLVLAVEDEDFQKLRRLSSHLSFGVSGALLSAARERFEQQLQLEERRPSLQQPLEGEEV